MDQEENESIFSDIRPAEKEASYLQKLGTGAADLACLVFFIFGVNYLLPDEARIIIARGGELGGYLYAATIMFLYRFLFMMIAGRTPGMMVTGTSYLNAELQPLSEKEKAIVVFTFSTRSTKLYKVR